MTVKEQLYMNNTCEFYLSKYISNKSRYWVGDYPERIFLNKTAFPIDKNNGLHICDRSLYLRSKIIILTVKLAILGDRGHIFYTY